MRRRDFLGVATGAIAFRTAAQAQTAVPLVGYLSSNAQGSDAKLIGQLQKGLSEKGFIEGKNFEIEFLWSEGGYEQLSSKAARLVARKSTWLLPPDCPQRLQPSGYFDDSYRLPICGRPGRIPGGAQL